MVKKKLSKRAERMYERLCDANNYYQWGRYMNSPTMKELVDAGLVGTQGRVILVQLCYVPALKKDRKDHG